jgi:hypothetical protein
MDEPSDGTSTARVPARDRNEYWRQVVCRTFVELEVTHQTAAGYRGSRGFGGLGGQLGESAEVMPALAERASSEVGCSRNDLTSTVARSSWSRARA